MNDRALGRTKMRVREIGFGAWAIGGNEHGNSYGPTEDSVSVQAVAKALNLGATFFDTADVYGWGHSEELLGEALGDRREEVQIATKVGGDFYHGGVRTDFSPAYIEFALDHSLQRLRTDHVDLYQLHNPPLALMQDPSTYDVLDRLQAENKVRHYGVSVHQPMEAVMAIQTGKPTAIQLPFSLFRQEWIEDVFPLAAKYRVGIIAREPLANGFLTGKYAEDATFPHGDIRHQWPPEMVRAQVRAAGRLATTLVREDRTLAQAALKFVLSFPEVSVTIPGAKTTEQVKENVAAFEAPDLTTAELTEVRELYENRFDL
ncbi:MAG: aldo/keto reductase [Thermoplasmata archaeon]|nr:aldo/keto reductase [Thermoplasmata archaeon]